jgi:hypothetical protein
LHVIGSISDLEVHTVTSETQNSTLTPEQFELARRLEGIFTPHTRKRRDALYNNGNSVRFVHYTSAEAALSIIKSKRVWMRNTTCMSDYREVQHGFDMLNKFFTNESKKRAFIEALDACSPNIGTEAIELFNQWWWDILCHTYISSISEHDNTEDSHGRLSMWRAFGGNIARVAIVFSIPSFSGGALALNTIFSPVAYLKEEEVETEISTVIENILANCDFLRSLDCSWVVQLVFNMLLTGTTCLKHEGFHEEREWRAIYLPKRSPSPLMEHSIEVVGGIPQLVYKLPLDVNVSPALAELDLSRIFDRLIIGPSPYPVAIYDAFVEALTTIGVPEAATRVCASGIPLRV